MEQYTPEQIQEWKTKAEQLDNQPNALLSAAMQIVTREMAKDKSEGSYYYCWQANIGMSFVDAYANTSDVPVVEYTALVEIANNAAKNFLDLLIKE